MKFKDFIYYVMLVIASGFFVVLAFSYFDSKDNQIVNVDVLNRFSLDLASGDVSSSGSGNLYNIGDIKNYDFLEFYFYSETSTGYNQVDVSDLIDFSTGHIFYSSLFVFAPGKIYALIFLFNLENDTVYISLEVQNFNFNPISGSGYFNIKGVNYV